MKPKIYLALVDDWELRGDGTGDVEQLQIKPLARILEVYEGFGFKASINAEIMQQLAHLKFGNEYPALKQIAKLWEEAVIDAYRRGHDVQLHIHSQWRDVQYKDGKWVIKSDWSILNVGREAMDLMVKECKAYLETLIQKVDPAYHCVSYRSGAWAAAPSSYYLSVLSENSIVFDVSIVDGLSYDNKVIKLDYRSCEESFCPFYPDMGDARKVSSKTEPIICIPTFSFRPYRRQRLRSDFQRLLGRAGGQRNHKDSINATANTSIPHERYDVWGGESNAGLGEKIRYRLAPERKVADLSNLSFDEMSSMVKRIREAATRSGLEEVPVILENHTKDIRDFGTIEKFAALVAAQKDMESITLSEIGAGLKSGRFKVGKKQV